MRPLHHAMARGQRACLWVSPCLCLFQGLLQHPCLSQGFQRGGSLSKAACQVFFVCPQPSFHSQLCLGIHRYARFLCNFARLPGLMPSGLPVHLCSTWHQPPVVSAAGAPFSRTHSPSFSSGFGAGSKHCFSQQETWTGCSHLTGSSSGCPGVPLDFGCPPWSRHFYGS